MGCVDCSFEVRSYIRLVVEATSSSSFSSVSGDATQARSLTMFPHHGTPLRTCSGLENATATVHWRVWGMDESIVMQLRRPEGSALPIVLFERLSFS